MEKTVGVSGTRSAGHAVLLACVFLCHAALGGEIHVTLRLRVLEGGRWRVRYTQEVWKGEETALIICDMWNRHWCAGATRRVAELAPHVERVVQKARQQGVFIIHAPSGTMKAYEGHPARKRAQHAPQAPDLPKGISRWCSKMRTEQGAVWPIDQSDGGCDCTPRCPSGSPWTRQIDSIHIAREDAISDSGREIWNLLHARNIRNLILLGVHTNMCVMGRPFGLRNMARFGKHVVLMRDMTDTMYNSRQAPYVRHFAGTDLIVEYIEKFVCPTITSTTFTGEPFFRFENDPRPHVILLSAESEYGACYTFPALAHFLRSKLDLSAEVLQGSTEKRADRRHFIPCMENLARADLLLLFVRRRALPHRDMGYLKAYLNAGKPLCAFRTSSHAFAPREPVPPALATWENFDREVLDCHYHGYWHGETVASLSPWERDNPILTGVARRFQVQETLYRSSPLSGEATVLLMGTCVDGSGAEARWRKRPGVQTADEPVAWTTRYGRCKVFYTSAGRDKGAFATRPFQRLVLNAILWALDRPIPTTLPLPRSGT